MVSAKRLRAEAAAAAEAAAEAAAAALSPDEKLQAVQEELKKMNAEAREKISEIRKNCLEKKKAIYDKQNEIIKGIPDFWLIVFSNHRMLKIVVLPEDREIFGYLDSLCVEYFEDPRKGYSIKLGQSLLHQQTAEEEHRILGRGDHKVERYSHRLDGW